MNSLCNSSIGSRGSHVSVYYEQTQEEEKVIAEHQLLNSCSSEERILQNPPVEIHQKNSVGIDMPPLTWHGYDNQPRLLTVTNTGRTILINGHWANSRPYIEGGPLNGTYLFSQIHFHCPSEHEIDGERYPLEMHIVHYKTSYLTQERAMHEKDGTLVLVYLFKCKDSCDTIISKITNMGPQLKTVNSQSELPGICLNNFIQPFTSNYYVYWGSVTTRKSCYLIQWIISCCALNASKKEVEDLSNIITCALGKRNPKHSPQVKPENDIIYHVGEDYSFPIIRTFSADDVCNICKCNEVSRISCRCKWKKGSPKEVEEGMPRILVCKCKSGTRVSRSICKMPKLRLCSKCRSTETICYKCHEKGEYKQPVNVCPHKCQVKESKSKKKVYCEVQGCEEDGVLTISCKSGSSKSSVEEKLCKKKKRKKNQSPKSKSSSDCESGKSSSKTSMVDKKSNSKKGAVNSDSECASNSEPSITSKAAEESKKEKRTRNPSNPELHKESDAESEKDSKCDADKNEKKEKKKKVVEIIESLYSVEENSSNKNVKTCTNFSSLDLTLNGPKPLSLNDQTEENPKIDSQVSEVKILLNCEPLKEDSSTCIGKNEKSDPNEKIARKGSPASSSLKSKSPASAQKLKRPGSSGQGSVETRRSKSKSPVLDGLKKKGSVKNDLNRVEAGCSKSKLPIRKNSQTKTGKNKKSSECNISQSVQEVKCLVTKSTTVIENMKRDPKSPGDIKTGNNKVQNEEPSKLSTSKSKEGGKGKNKANVAEQKSEDVVKTLFEKKQDAKKVKSPLVGDNNDVQINFLLAPNPKSIPSYVLTTSESDFMEDKMECEDTKENKTGFMQDLTLNAATIYESQYESDKHKERSQVCLLMEHLFRMESKGQNYKCSSQEYCVAIMFDRNILQEYKGKFHPEELRPGTYEALDLVPKYQEPENSHFRLQDCSVKKESLDEIRIRVKFLVNEMNIKPVIKNTQNKFNDGSEKKVKVVFDEETQCSNREFNLTEIPHSESLKETQNVKKIMDCRNYETLNSEYKSKKEEKQNGQSKHRSSSSPKKATKESQKCIIKLRSEPDTSLQNASESSATEELFTESDMKENKREAICSEQNDKKLKPLFVKRRKTVYFMYDKVEKDESTGKKVFVGSFRTKEEVEELKKQKKLNQENDVGNASEKFTDNHKARYLLSFENKMASGLEVLKLEEPHKKNTPCDNHDIELPDQNSFVGEKDVVTLHKFKPKPAGMDRFMKECKNVLIGKVVNNLQKDTETFRNLAEIIGVDKEKAPRISIYELQEVSESEWPKENIDPESCTTRRKIQTKNVVLTKDQIDHFQTEAIVPDKSSTAEENSTRHHSQKSPDRKESQAALILIPVEVESLSKIEVILIEHLDNFKKTKKEDEYIPCLNLNK